MNQLVPFTDTAQLPAHLTGADAAAFNTDLTSHVAPAFPVCSIKGKVFAIVRDGDRRMVMNPKDPDSPATHIDVVLVKANKATSKVLYLEGYDEKAEAKKPDCWSNDGVKPDPTAESPQAVACAGCPNNQWGSKIGTGGGNNDGKAKGKACADVVRMAIAAPNQLNDPMLLRVPPSSLRPLGEYGAMLAKRGVGYNQVITKVAFDMEVPTPKLTFKALAFITEDMYANAKEIAGTDVVRSIIGSIFGTGEQEASASAAPKVTPLAPTTPAPAPAAAAPAPARTRAAPKPATAAKANGNGATAPAPAAAAAEAPAAPAGMDIGGMNVDLNLSNLSFDD